MTYKAKGKIKLLIAAGLLTFNLSGCKKQIHGYYNAVQESIKDIDSLVENKKIENFKKKLEEGFEAHTLTLDKTANKLVSNVVIDGTKASFELKDESEISGTLYHLEMTDVSLENLYIYDSKYTEDLYNAETKYQDYEEKGYENVIEALYDDYKKHKKLEIQFQNCSVWNEYKKGEVRDVEFNRNDLEYKECKKIWVDNMSLYEDSFSKMLNLETLILTEPRLTFLKEETITIHSDTLKNIIIDGQSGWDYMDKFDFTQCPNLERVSIVGDSQETNLDGLKGLMNLKELAFGLPTSKYYDTNGLIYKDFQERIDMISAPFSSTDKSLTREPNCMISDISAINGNNMEVLNISFLQRVSSHKLLETVKSLPNLKEIVGFEVKNAGMCSDELVQYCKEQGIRHPFTEKSLEIKHRLEKIVSDVVTDNMNEEEKIKALSQYVISHMEYDYNLISNTEASPEKIKEGWGESLYYSVMEGRGVCQGYTTYAQNLFNEAGIESFKTDGIDHTWNLVQIEDEYYFVDLTNVDSLIDEQLSTSFDNYNLEEYYLVPVKEEEEFFRIPIVLPVEAEKQYEGTKKKKVEDYVIQVDTQNRDAKRYSVLYAMIGIGCALGLAKMATNKQKTLVESKTSKNREELINVKSLKELIDSVKRNQKLEELKNKREIAEKERIRNRKAKELEREANHQEERGAN